VPRVRGRTILPAALIRYQITDGSAALDEACWLARLREDVDFIQIREQPLSARELARLVRRAMSIGPRILVNDRTDIAIACGAAGVHLRSRSVSPLSIRKIAPAGFIISVACHTEEDTDQAEGADYVVLAPIFQPLSKPGTREPLGLEMLHRITRRQSIPLIALGGITESNAHQCIAAGAAGIAGITLFS
jgi:thiamine-phosphate pyrophosphorylase